MGNQPTLPNISLRSATRDDLPTLTALCCEVQGLHVEGRPDLFADTEARDLSAYLARCLDREDFSITVAVVEDQVRGYVLDQDVNRAANPFRKAEHALYIHHIGVARETRGRSIGSALINSVMERAADTQCSAIRLDSWAFNAEAHMFFARHGFSPMNIVFENRLPRG